MFSDVRMTELGKIKIGGLGKVRQSASGSAWRAPEKSDHFTVTTMNRGPDQGGARGDLVPDTELMSQLKKDPSLCNENGDLVRLPIYVLSNELDDIMQSSYVWYGGKTVGARTEFKDGKMTVTWFSDRKNGAKLKEPLTEEWNPAFLELVNSKNAKLFKQHTVFNCVIAAAESRWGGVFKLRTTSVITAKQLYSGLVNLSSLTGGVLIGLPMYLFIRPIQVSPEGKATTVYVVGVEMRGTDYKQILDRARDTAKFMLERKEEVRQIQEAQRKMIVLPGFEGKPDAEEINDEFQPETAREEAEAPPNHDFESFLNGEPAKDAEVVDVEKEKVTDLFTPKPAPVMQKCQKCGSEFSLTEDKCPLCGNEDRF